MKKVWQKFWWLLPVSCLLAASVIALGILKPIGKHNIQSAQPVVSCQSTPELFSCWQKHYSAIVNNQSPEAAFTDFKQSYSQISFVKTNCHQIAHVIGRAAAKKYPTLTETYKHGDNFCWSGYYHGAIETIATQLGTDKILAQINDVCAEFLKSKPYSFDHYNCVHGMGHGLMAVQNDQLFTALTSCDKYQGVWQQQSCYGGVFMENTMNEINPGEHSAFLKSDDLLYPCDAVNNRYKEQCFLMQTSHALKVVNYDYDKIFSVCSSVERPYNITCFQSLGRDISGNFSSDKSKTITWCMQGPSHEAQDNCFTGAAKDFVSYYHDNKQVLAMCADIPNSALASNCKLVSNNYYKTF